MEEFIYNQILGHIHVDMLGRLYAEIDPQMIPEADRSTEIVTVMALEKQDLQGGIRMDKQVVPDVCMVDASGIVVDQYGGSRQSFFALSPGHIFGEYGSPEILDRLLVGSQVQCNQVAGLRYGWAANRYKNLSAKLTSHNFMISCFPNQYVTYEVEATDTPRGELVQRNFIPRRRSMRYSSEDGTWEIELDLEAESFQQNAVAYVPPSGEDISIPPIQPFPPIPTPYPQYPGDPSGDDAPPVVLMLDASKGVLRTDNFDAATNDIVWQFWNSGIATADLPYFRSNVNIALSYQNSFFFQCPNGAVYLGVYEKNFQRWVDTIYRAPAIGAFWEKVIDQTWLTANEGTDGGIIGMGYNPNKAEEVAFIAIGSAAGFQTPRHFWIGNPSGWTQGASVSIITNFVGNITFGTNKWVWGANRAAEENFVIYSADGSTQETVSSGMGQGSIVFHYRAGTSPFLIKKGTLDSSILIYSQDNGATFAQIDVDPETIGGNLEISPDGYMMGDLGVALKGRSSDFGFTWGANANLNPGSWYCWKWCGGAGATSRWIAARANIWYSPDWGGTWQDKDGNMPYLIPLSPTILKIIVPGYH
jgi:hypothetical protein